MKNKITAKKAGSIAINVLLYLFLALCVFSLIMTVVSKKTNDDAVSVFGCQLRVVTTDSMAKCEETDVSAYDVKSIPKYSMIFVDSVPEDKAEADEWYASLRVGDVLTFRYVYNTQITITHRITSITEKADGGYMIYLEGDNKASESKQLLQVIDTADPNSPNYILGRVTGKSFPLGFFVSLLKTPVGIVLLIMVPCFIIILLEVIRIVGVLGGEKKKREQEEKERKDNEIEELKRKLAELEQKNQTNETREEKSE